MGLQPTYFARALKVSDKREMCDRLESLKIGLCIECGSCSFVCPAKRPLVENNRLAKAALREFKTSEAALAKKKEEEKARKKAEEAEKKRKEMLEKQKEEYAGGGLLFGFDD